MEPDLNTAEPLTGCGALVTGGSRGIGRAVALRLAADGAHVVLTYRTQEAAARDAVRWITDSGGTASAVQIDFAQPDRVENAFSAVDQHLAAAGVGLDVVVANAGVFASAPIAEASVADWERVMTINATGAFLTLQYAARRLRDHGRIITISTVGTAWPSSGEAAYAASKGAVEQLTRVASRELGERGITANTVSLGPTDTDLLGDTPREALEGAAAITALGRLGRPEDAADFIALLAHPDNRWVTGQNIRADGGLT